MLYYDEGGAVVDVRGMPCVLRHAAVMDLFDALKAEESFVVVNDHDPAPLRRHFESRTVCGYAWEYLERGPQAWRVRVTRR